MSAPQFESFEPMLAKSAKEIPVGPRFVYEPKWDGFRAVVIRDGDALRVWSRDQKPLARYFPELIDAFKAIPEKRYAVDGEILIHHEGEFDFSKIMTRIHPAESRVKRLSAEIRAWFIAFDALHVGEDDLRRETFEIRRARLEDLFAIQYGPLFITPCSAELGQARRWLDESHVPGIDGVVAKHLDLQYQPGKRVMVKVKQEHTVDCVVAGVRWDSSGRKVGTLLLGLYDRKGVLRHIGTVRSLSDLQRRQMYEALEPARMHLEGHPWEHGFGVRGPARRLAGSASRWEPSMGLNWEPLRPTTVAEVSYTQLDPDGFRHGARFVRWRPERSPTSCTTDQLPLKQLALEPGPAR